MQGVIAPSPEPEAHDYALIKHESEFNDLTKASLNLYHYAE